MGAADIIPGVSGGTVALILGIYERLVTAVSHVDLQLVESLRGRRFTAAAKHLDLRFLLALGCGIAVGVVGLASIMNRLLTTEATRGYTLAAFFGLIFASSILVARMVNVRTLGEAVIPVLLALCGGLFAFWLTGLRGLTAGEPSLLYYFLSGGIAICAMILPGISGAFLMLLLGVYVPISGILDRLKDFALSASDVATLACFGTGCVIGLLVFSKFLRWLLVRHEPPTMALLAGFMIGSLRKIWPFQRDATAENLDRVGLSSEEIETLREHSERIAELPAKHRWFESIPPSELAFDQAFFFTVLIALAAAGFVLLLDWLTKTHEQVEPLEPADHEPQA